MGLCSLPPCAAIISTDHQPLRFYQPAASRSFIRKEKTGLSIMFIALPALLLCFPASGVSPFYLAMAVLLTLLYAVPLLPVKALHVTRKARVLKTIAGFYLGLCHGISSAAKEWTLLSGPDIFIPHTPFPVHADVVHHLRQPR